MDDEPTLNDVLLRLLELADNEPEVLIAGVITTAISVGFFLFAMTWAISRAGHFQPPVVVLSVVVGLVAMVAILAALVRPETEALTVAAGTAVGALAGALGTAFTQAKGEDPRDVDDPDLGDGDRMVPDWYRPDGEAVADPEGGPE